MKTLKLSILLFVAVFTANAQSAERYIAAMKQGLTMLDSARSSEQFAASANYFERVAAVAQQQWLPQYYAGFCNLHVALVGKQDNDAKDALYDKAMNYAEKAAQLKPNDSEIGALMGYITYMKMAVEPQTRAMTMIPKANAFLDKAIALNPENPRAYFIKGQDTFYTPEAFGGGKARAKGFFTTAVEKFEKDKPADFKPNWGYARCKSLLQQCN